MKPSILLWFFGYVNLASGYVLQIREDARGTNVDAVLHRKVRDDNLAKGSRRQLRMQSDSEEESAETVKLPKPQPRGQSFVLGVKTGAEPSAHRSRGMDELLQFLMNAYLGQEAVFRTKTFEFTTNEAGAPRTRSSTGIELDTQSLLRIIHSFISSPKFRRAAEDAARKAAIVFRTLKQDL